MNTSTPTPGDTGSATLFRPDAARYIGLLTRRAIVRNIWIALLVLGGCGVAALSDLRFAFVGIIFALIVYPMVLVMVWLTHGARPATALLTRPQRWARRSDGAIVITFYPFTAMESDEAAEASLRAAGTLTFTPGEVTAIDAGGRAVAIWLRKGRADGVRLLTAPADALPPGTIDLLNKMTTFKV
ncbi:MAG: hypothetical protein J6C67_05225 [Muribaculaceae bacterium]|nr:hypothetical protein [Muribaculaceae bacterium]